MRRQWRISQRSQNAETHQIYGPENPPNERCIKVVTLYGEAETLTKSGAVKIGGFTGTISRRGARL
jgi:hypothetical protein